MKEREPKFRPYLVCYDENRQVSSLTKAEMEQLVMDEDVDWVTYEGQRLDNFELDVYRAKLLLERNYKKEVANNREIAQSLSQLEPISRNAVSRARKRIAHKLNYKPGW